MTKERLSESSGDFDQKCFCTWNNPNMCQVAGHNRKRVEYERKEEEYYPADEDCWEKTSSTTVKADVARLPTQ